MSNCLVLQGKNFIAIGADTASSILIDKKYRRIGVDAKKLYQFGNEIMFCSGKMELVELVTSNVVTKDNKIVLDDLTEFIKSLNIEKSDTYDLEILICGVENNKSYMHQISQYNDFEVKTITNNTNGCAIYSTGFNTKTMLDTAKKNYPLCQNVSDLFIKSFNDISSEEVGGYINMYLLQENQTTKCVDNYKVDDIETISVSRNDIHYVVADVLIGDLIFGKTLHINNGKDTLIMDENGLTITNGVNTIIFDPNNTELMRVTNLDKKIFYFNELGDLFIDGNIFGGSLHLENDIGTYVDIDPDKENIMEIACLSNSTVSTFSNTSTVVSLPKYPECEEIYYSTYKTHIINNEVVLSVNGETFYKLQNQQWELASEYSDILSGRTSSFLGIIDNYIIELSITWRTIIQFTNIDTGEVTIYKSTNADYAYICNNLIYEIIRDINSEFEINVHSFSEGKCSLIKKYDLTNITTGSEDKRYYSILCFNEDLSKIYLTFANEDDNYNKKILYEYSISSNTMNKLCDIDVYNPNRDFIYGNNDKGYIDGDNLIIFVVGGIWFYGESHGYPDYLLSKDIYNLKTNTLVSHEQYTMFESIDASNPRYKLYFYKQNDSILYSIYDCNSSVTEGYGYNIGAQSPLNEKIFYVTKDGVGYFNGDIYARSLTLGEDVTIDTSDISGMDNYLDDYVSDSNIITSDDFKYKTETDENGVTKVTVTCDGVTSTTYSSADSNYVLTNVGLGEGTDTYCKISKDGLLTAKNAIIYGELHSGKGYIGGWEIGTNGLKSVGFDTSTGISLDSTGKIFAKGSSRYLYVADGQMYIGDGNVVDTSKKYSYISSEGIYLASDESLSQGEWLFEANINEDWVVVSTHSPAKPALYVRNRSNTDTSNILGDASGIRIQTDYAGFSNRPLDIITKTGNDDGTQTYIYMNVFGEYKGSGDGSSYDTQGRLTLRSAINTGTGWIGNDTSLSNGYIPSSIGSTAFRWGQGFFHDLTITNPLKVTSDKKLKDHINYLDSKESLEFINHLQPAEYTMTYSENKRVHRGFYAQEVSKVSNNMGFDNLSLYSAYVEKDGEISPYDANEDDENLRWSLSYDEFIAPMVSAMQELSKENNELKDKVTELEDRLEKLEKLLIEK